MPASTKIKSADIRPGDIIKFEYGDYDNWVTARIDEVHFRKDSTSTYYPQKLIWHYFSDESGESEPQREALESKPQRDCRAEKLGNNPAWEQHICYSNPNDIVEKLN